MKHGLMSMTWRTPALSLTAGQVQIALPGSLLNDPGGDNNVWLGNGVVERIHVNSRDGTGAELALVQIYDYLDESTQRLIAGGTPALPLQADATANRTPTKGDDMDMVIHGATIDAGIAAPAFLAAARLLWQDKAVVEDGTGGIRDMIQHDVQVECRAGMVVVLRAVGAVTGDWSVSVTYRPESLGGYRRKRQDQVSLLPI